MKKTLFYFLLLTTALLAVSCASPKKVAYFQGIDNARTEDMVGRYQVRIMPNDNLYITVSALNSDAVMIFNSINTNANVNVNMETLNLTGYLVDDAGFINFPVIGRVQLGGLTKAEAVELLRTKVSDYIVNPVVNIRFVNYKVTVLGEVMKPGTFTVKDERVTIPEALGMAGDMTIYGKRDNVLICRETNGEKTFARLDMTSPDVFSSEYFYLQQNDIVYVQPNKARAGSSSYNQNLSLGVSLLSLLVTIAFVVF